MFIKVRGYRGCEKADIEVANVALLAGMNGAAKSSICQAVAAALTGSPIPYFRSDKPDKPLLTKTEAKSLVRGGMDAGSVTITLPGATVPAVAAGWPKLTWEGDGTLQASKTACGMVTPLEMLDDDRQRFFADLLKTDPSAEDLREALVEAIPALKPDEDEIAEEKAGTSKTRLTQIVEKVTLNGYDTAHRLAKEQGAKLKGHWEAAAGGEAFGSKKADGWRPPNWRKELEEMSEEDAATIATKAQAKLDDLIKNQAVGEAEIAALEAAAKDEVTAYTALQEAQQTVEGWSKTLTELQAELNKITVPSAIPCPHCAALVDVLNGANGEIVLHQSEATENDIAKAKDRHAKAAAAVREANLSMAAASVVLNSARGRHDSLKGSAERLKASKGKSVTVEQVDEARDYYNGVNKDLEMIKQVEQAASAAQNIAINQGIVDILAPEGLRRQKLQRALTKFNKDVLGALSAEAEFPNVTINDKLDVLYGGRHYFLLSESEKYRVRSVVQIAVATIDKSKVVILDGADILDSAGRNGLFAMIGSIEGMHFLIGMTFSGKANAAGKPLVPDLEKAGMGKTYWVEEGIAAPL